MIFNTRKGEGNRFRVLGIVFDVRECEVCMIHYIQPIKKNAPAKHYDGAKLHKTKLYQSVKAESTM